MQSTLCHQDISCDFSIEADGSLISKEANAGSILTFKLSLIYMLFSCAESNANELEQKILLICIRFGT